MNLEWCGGNRVWFKLFLIISSAIGKEVEEEEEI